MTTVRRAPGVSASPVVPSIHVDDGTGSRAGGLLELRHLRAAVLIGAMALVFRLVAINRSYELFVDEITYSTLGHNLARGRGLTLYGQPFTLHPPAVFGLYAVIVDVFGIHGSTDHYIMALRPVSAVFGALVCAGVYLLVERAAGRRAALVAGLLLALDPFAISYDSLVMLEAPAGAASVAVFGLVAAAAQTTAASRRRVFVALSGLMTAVVVTTKDTFGLVAMGGLLSLLATGWVLRRREVLVMLVIGAAGYLEYLDGLLATHDLAAWWSANIGGFLRLIGARQVTGFNSPSVHVSLLSRAIAELGGNASSYAALALGPVAAIALLSSNRPWQRDWHDRATPAQRAAVVIALWTAAAAAYIVYATLFGSIEEQMYYILLDPAIAAIAVAAATLRYNADEDRACRGIPAFKPKRLSLRQAGAVLALVALVYNGSVWTRVHTSANNGYSRFLEWASVNIRPGSTVSVTDGLAQFLLTGVNLGDWDTLTELREHRVQLVLVSVRLIDQGYTTSPAFLELLERHGRLLYSSTQPIGLRVYGVQSLTGAP